MPRPARRSLLSIALVDAYRFRGGKRRATGENDISVLARIPWILDDATVLWPLVLGHLAIRATPGADHAVAFRMIERNVFRTSREERQSPTSAHRKLRTDRIDGVLRAAARDADALFAAPDPGHVGEVSLSVNAHLNRTRRLLASKRHPDRKLPPGFRRRVAARFHHALRHLGAALAADPAAAAAFAHAVRFVDACAGVETTDGDLLDLLHTGERGRRIRQWIDRFPVAAAAAFTAAPTTKSDNTPIWRHHRLADAIAANAPSHDVLGRIHGECRLNFLDSDRLQAPEPSARALRSAYGRPLRDARRSHRATHHDVAGGTPEPFLVHHAAAFAVAAAHNPDPSSAAAEHLPIHSAIASRFPDLADNPAGAAAIGRLRRLFLARAKHELETLSADGLDAMPAVIRRAVRRYGLPLNPTALRCATLALDRLQGHLHEARDAATSFRQAFCDDDAAPGASPWHDLYRHRGTGAPRWREWLDLTARWRDGGGYAVAAALARLDRDRDARIRWLSPPPPPIEGFTVTPLTTASALHAEGADMEHCVGGYLRHCLKTEVPSHLYGLADADGRRSTLEIKERKDGFAIAQHQARKNHAPPPAHHAAARHFAEALRHGPGAEAYDPVQARRSRISATVTMHGTPEARARARHAHRAALLQVFPELARARPGLAAMAAKDAPPDPVDPGPVPPAAPPLPLHRGNDDDVPF